MELYLYRTADKAVVMKLENVLDYTDREVRTDDGVYGPLAEGLELSGTADCAGTLRADWRKANPTQEARLEDVEALLAEILFGGEAI